MRTPARDDHGQAATVEVLLLLVIVLAGWFFIAYLGRLNAAGQNLENAAQSAARAASQTGDPATGEIAAADILQASNLDLPCTSRPAPDLTWRRAPDGGWRGGTVTVRIRCEVRNQALGGIWSPGTRTITGSDTQIIDRFAP